MNWLAGDVHTHTKWSDGAVTADDAVKQAEAAGLDFIIVTDHSYGFFMKPLLTARGIRQKNIHPYIKNVEGLNKEGGCIVIAGIEIGNCELFSQGHLLAFPDKYFTSEYSVRVAGQPRKTGHIVNEMKRLGAFGYAAHPGSQFFPFSWRGAYKYLMGIEVISGGNELLTTGYKYYPNFDYHLWWDLLRDGHKVFGVAGTDSHFGSRSAKLGDIVTWAYAENGTREEVLESLKLGRTCFGTGALIEMTAMCEAEYRIPGETLHLVQDDKVNLHIRGKNKNHLMYGKVRKVKVVGITKKFVYSIASVDVGDKWDEKIENISLPEDTVCILAVGENTTEQRICFTNPVFIDRKKGGLVINIINRQKQNWLFRLLGRVFKL